MAPLSASSVLPLLVLLATAQFALGGIDPSSGPAPRPTPPPGSQASAMSGKTVPGGNAPIFGVQATGADQPNAGWLISLKAVTPGEVNVQDASTSAVDNAKNLTCSFVSVVGCVCQQYYPDMQMVLIRCASSNAQKLTTHPTAKQTVKYVTFDFPVKAITSRRSLLQDVGAGTVSTGSTPSTNSTGGVSAEAAFVPVCPAGQQIMKPTWGLDRINQKATALDMKYDWANCGKGAQIFVVDTGVENVNDEFSGRVTAGVSCVSGTCVATSTLSDCHGHGSHCAGTAGSKTYGVAKGVYITSVAVLDCSGSGSFSNVIAGLNWVAAANSAGRRKVVSMSLGGAGQVPAMDDVIQSLVTTKNTPVVVAAGNSADDACYYTPASAPYAITVGATTISDGLAYFSNYGPCININAPGVDIWSVSRVECSASPTFTCPLSGTSMATPHVAGTIAMYLTKNPTAAAFPTVYSNVRTLGGPIPGAPLAGGTTNTLVYSKM